jgi:hypothetical protein
MVGAARNAGVWSLCTGSPPILAVKNTATAAIITRMSADKRRKPSLPRGVQPSITAGLMARCAK